MRKLTILFLAACALVAGAQAQPPAAALRPGVRLTAEQVQELEQSLAKDPSSIGLRMEVMQYYFQNRQKEPLLKHINWAIENSPGSTAASMGASMLTAPSIGGPLFAADDVTRAKEMFLRQATAHPDDAPLVQNAAALLQSTEVLKAEEMLRRARQANPAVTSLNQRLAQLYVACIIQTAAQLPENRRPIKDAEGARILADRVKAELVTSDNKVLVQEAARMLKGLPVARPQFASLKEFRDRVEERAGQLGVAPESAQRIRVGPDLQAAKLVTRIEPNYPAEAKAAGIQGTVRVEAVIAKDGKVESVKVLAGPLELSEAAENAVKRWVYKPTLLNGQPVEVITAVDLNFTLPAK